MLKLFAFFVLFFCNFADDTNLYSCDMELKNVLKAQSEEQILFPVTLLNIRGLKLEVKKFGKVKEKLLGSICEIEIQQTSL